MRLHPKLWKQASCDPHHAYFVTHQAFTILPHAIMPLKCPCITSLAKSTPDVEFSHYMQSPRPPRNERCFPITIFFSTNTLLSTFVLARIYRILGLGGLCNHAFTTELGKKTHPMSMCPLLLDSFWSLSFVAFDTLFLLFYAMTVSDVRDRV